MTLVSSSVFKNLKELCWDIQQSHINGQKIVHESNAVRRKACCRSARFYSLELIASFCLFLILSLSFSSIMHIIYIYLPHAIFNFIKITITILCIFRAFAKGRVQGVHRTPKVTAKLLNAKNMQEYPYKSGKISRSKTMNQRSAQV